MTQPNSTATSQRRSQPLNVSPRQVESKLDHILEELLTGYGAVVIEQGVNVEDVADQRERLIALSAHEGDKVTHFQGANTDDLHLQRRVWNLLNKGATGCDYCSRVPR